LHSLPQSPFSPSFPPSQIFNFRFASRSPLKNFYAFSPAKPHVSLYLKFIFDFSFDPSPHLAYRHLMQNELLTAVADSTATGLPIDVTIHADSIESSIAFLRSRFMDVDWDTFPNRVTIFGDDQRIEGDEDEGLWVLNLVFAPAPARFAY
jgi:hypothetical protein